VRQTECRPPRGSGEKRLPAGMASKGDSITLTGGKLKFKAMSCASSDWKLKSPYLATEAEAKSFIDAIFKGEISLAGAAAAE